MGPLLFDTNVVSFFVKGHSFGALYRRYMDGRELAISFMTVAELYAGAYRKNWGRDKLVRLEAHLLTYMIIPCTPAICRMWGRIRAARKHRPVSGEDAWIAACALAHDCPLVTHNPDDFVDIEGLHIITAPRPSA